MVSEGREMKDITKDERQTRNAHLGKELTAFDARGRNQPKSVGV